MTLINALIQPLVALAVSLPGLSDCYFSDIEMIREQMGFQGWFDKGGIALAIVILLVVLIKSKRRTWYYFPIIILLFPLIAVFLGVLNPQFMLTTRIIFVVLSLLLIILLFKRGVLSYRGAVGFIILFVVLGVISYVLFHVDNYRISEHKKECDIRMEEYQFQLPD
jgi:hypothetical protein